jgi:RimJ/RimL family protein N-acetyltransferase
MIIRRLRSADAAAYLELVNKTDAESDFMMQEPGERQMTPFQLIISLNTGGNNIFVAEDDGKLIGQLVAFNMYGRNKRVVHVLHIGISILKSYWGKGVGTKLFEYMEKWAIENGTKRLELSVMTHNERGIALYKKMGFEIEGTKKASIFVNGKYVDEYLMSKILSIEY